MAVNDNLQDFIQSIVNAVGKKTGKTIINAQNIASEIDALQTDVKLNSLGNLVTPKLTVVLTDHIGDELITVKQTIPSEYVTLTAVYLNPQKWDKETKSVMCKYSVDAPYGDSNDVEFYSIQDYYGAVEITEDTTMETGDHRLINDVIFNGTLFKGTLTVYWPIINDSKN
jgi:hypothetical protein